jgi:YggT family protein
MGHEGSFTLTMAAYTIARVVVLIAALASLLIALGSWAVTTRRISPFSRLARAIRTVSDPILGPIEHWLVPRGKNPQDAPWWLLGGVIVGGILVLTGSQWLIGMVLRVLAAGAGGWHAMARLGIYLVVQLLSLALIARVIGSWFGAGRFNPWLRPAYRLTDWMVEPLRRIIPPIGVIDVVPLAAWLLLQVLLSIALRHV